MSREKPQKKRRGNAVQELIGIKDFTQYGLQTNKGELLFCTVAPTNISVLSHANIEIKVRHLMMVLSAIPDIEINCTDSSECFDDNKAYLHRWMEEERNQKVKALVEKVITEQGFEVRRMKKEDIKRFLSIYFDASVNGELMPDVDGEQFCAYVDKED